MAGVQDAHSLFEQEANSRKITTFCKDLDDALGGGVSVGHIVEFCGLPAVGKTQLGIQLALNVQIPQCFGGIGGRALYIDAEGGLTTERVVQMAGALLSHLQRQARTKGGTKRQEAVKALSVESLVKGIVVLRVLSPLETCAAVEMLEQHLLEDGLRKDVPSTTLIVFDSLSCHLSRGLGDYSKRTRALSYLSERFMSLTAKNPSVAVVLINQLTTKFNDTQEPYLAHALGDTWAQTATERVDLRWQGGTRVAHITKSADANCSKVTYMVTHGGIRAASGGKHTSPMPLLQDSVSRQCMSNCYS